MYRSLSLAALLVALAATGAAAAPKVPAAFLEGTFRFETYYEGGSALDGLYDSLIYMTRVRFERQERFLVLKSMSPEYSGKDDPTNVNILARFPYKAAGDDLEVAFGDDPTPFSASVDGETFRSAGPHDVTGYELDSQAQYLTFVKEMRFTSDTSGSTETRRIRYSFLKGESSTYKPKVYPKEMQSKFGAFSVNSPVLENEDTGKVGRTRHVARIDLSKPWVWEFHPTVPEVCKQPIKDALESWNDVFEATNGVRPFSIIEGKREHTPGDLRHHTIYFRSRSDDWSSQSAFGTSSTDHFTGEVVDATVSFPALRFMEDLTVALEVAEKNAQKAAKKATAAKAGGHEVGVKVLGALAPFAKPSTVGEPVVDPNFVEDDLDALSKAYKNFYFNMRGTATHEFGHTLGLRHNFAGSADIKGRPEGDDSTSIMDYMTKGPRAHGPGVYDIATIAWLYDGKTPEASQRKFLYETDASDSPLANQYDENDPLAFYMAKTDRVLGPLQRGEKLPQSIRRIAARILEIWLPSVGKFVNNIQDERSHKAFAFLNEMLRMRFPETATYKSIEFLSITRYAAAKHGLLNAGSYLTRKQRAALVSGMYEAVLDRTQVLERERLGFVKLLASISHGSAFDALENAKTEIDARLKGGDLRDVEVEIERNVRVALIKAIENFESQ